MRKLFLGAAALALMIFPALAGTIGPMGLGEAVLRNAIDVAVNGYSITGYNVIERRTDGTVIVQVSTTTGPVLLAVRSGESVIGEHPCYAQYGGFHKLVGGLCVYDPDMYVSQQSWSAPKTVVTDVEQDACFVSTKTTTHAGRNILNGYSITEVETVENSAC